MRHGIISPKINWKKTSIITAFWLGYEVGRRKNTVSLPLWRPAKHNSDSPESHTHNAIVEWLDFAVEKLSKKVKYRKIT